MEKCRKCGGVLPPGAVFCPFCGREVSPVRSPKKRGNGQGSVYRLPNGKYKASVTLGYFLDENGKKHRRSRTQVFDRKKDAVAALPELAKNPARELRSRVTFKELYDLWVPTHRAGPSAMKVYQAAFGHFRDVWHLRLSELELDDLQECLDESGCGRQTRANMKTVCGLMYKYGIPRHLVPENLNLAQFLVVSGEGVTHRESFTDVQIEMVRQAVGVVPFADYIYCMIYTGFRPSEFLALRPEDFDPVLGVLTGGAKTEAGRGRLVTVSPKIRSIVDRLAASGSAFLFCDSSGGQISRTQFAERCFFPALEKIGIENPLLEVGAGQKRHRYSPHTCRHTFASLMKRISGADKDKLELIGHSSSEMLRYYQDVTVADLKRITDVL